MARILFEGWFGNIWERKYAFFSVFFAILLISYGFLFAIDFIPEAPDQVVSEVRGVEVADAEQVAPEVVAEEQQEVDPLPLRIIIDVLDKDVTVLNPESRKIADLDHALLGGVVRHPDSADFENTGNMFLFGHSSYLPNVLNRNFQAFNGLQKLVWGDEIRVQSADTEYVYRVKKTIKAQASEASVEIEFGEPTLTLATCNSFGSIDDRFIVTAELIETRPLETG